VIIRIQFSLLILICTVLSLEAQIVSFPYSESFDDVIAPDLPHGWLSVGFKDTVSGSYSTPNCIYGIGNSTAKSLTSPIFDFTNCIPEKLIFREKRSSTAAVYRLEIHASIDGISFDILLARFDTISSTSGYVQRSIDLKNSGLQNQPNVRFQWLLLADSVNTKGVLRIDDVSLTISTGLDVGITSMVVLPANATRKDALSFAVKVKNYGSLTASNFSVQYFIDSDRNGLAESKEQFSVVSGLVLNPGDSLICNSSHLPMKAGEVCFIAVIGLSQDGNRANDTASTFMNIRCIKGDLLINEIMYAPSGDEQEWVEIYNASPDSINLKNWKISDSNTATKSNISQSDRFIAPGSFIVAAKDVDFSVLHPDVYSVIANFSALNNSTPDAVILYDVSSRSIDSVMYQPNWGGRNGKSLERIDLNMSSISAANWGSSLDSTASTPGKTNSIARLDFDLAIDSLTQTRIVSAGKIISAISTTVRNIGRNAIDSVTINIYANSSFQKYPDKSDLLQSVVLTQGINAGDSVQVSEPLPQLGPGEMCVVVAAENWRDERLSNNSDTVIIKTAYELHSIIVNELMHDPLNGQNEWFELYNRSSQPIDLAYWTFNDRPTSSGVNSFTISDSSMMIQPGGFTVVASDSSVCNFFTELRGPNAEISLSIHNRSGGFGFNNDGDAVVLKDLTGHTIDSVAYLAQWHHPDVIDTRGRSLERINPNAETNDSRNWSTCTKAAGGTPGRINSVLTTSKAINSSISISPNPFSPDGDGFEDYCIVHYSFPMSASILNVKIYDIKGRCIRTLANCEFAGMKGEIIWDGFDESRRKVRIGVYVVYIEATDKSSGRVESAKAVAVVAAKL